jgi:hypothetical protein
MPKNPLVQLILGIALVAWVVYDLTAQGEAQNPIVIGMQWFAGFGGAVWVVFGILGLAAGKRPSGQGKAE